MSGLAKHVFLEPRVSQTGKGDNKKSRFKGSDGCIHELKRTDKFPSTSIVDDLDILRSGFLRV